MMTTKELIKAVENERGSAFQNCRECEYGTHNGEVIEKLKRLAELEDKIENGEIVYPKYSIYSNVYIIDFLDENGYSVHNGKPVVRECFVTSITQMTRTATSVLYRVQPHKLPREVMNGDVDNEFWDRGFYERDLFSTPEEAEKRLKELQDND